MENQNSVLPKEVSSFLTNLRNEENKIEKKIVRQKFSDDFQPQTISQQTKRRQSQYLSCRKNTLPTLSPLIIQHSISAHCQISKFSFEPEPENLIFNDNFKKLSKLGIGYQALGCFKCIDLRDDQIVVIKQMKNCDEEINTQIKAEYDFIKKLDHENIVKAKELIIEQDFCQIVMEYAEGKQLIHYLKKLKEIQIIQISKQIFSALAYLHEKKIIHRDLHFNNIIYNKKNEKIKIIDFGIAKQLKDKMFGASNAGGVEYRAPEMLNLQLYNCKVDTSLFFQNLIESLLIIDFEKRVSSVEALNQLCQFEHDNQLQSRNTFPTINEQI